MLGQMHLEIYPSSVVGCLNFAAVILLPSITSQSFNEENQEQQNALVVCCSSRTNTVLFSLDFEIGR
jgi:hypothetical protein